MVTQKTKRNKKIQSSKIGANKFTKIKKIDELSVVIPAYNEQERLPDRLFEIIDYLVKNKYDYEIIVVDDGSTDSTAKIVKEFMQKNKKIYLVRNIINYGKGFSVKRGMIAAKKKYVLFTDSDKSTAIAELPKLEEHIKTYDIVIGSRGLKESDVQKKQSFYKVIFGKLGNKLIQLIATPGIKDTQCGFKLFRKNSLFIFGMQTIDRWGFDFEILFIAKKHKLKIKEVPVIWINDERTKLKFIDYFKTLTELLKIRLNSLKGKYK